MANRKRTFRNKKKQNKNKSKKRVTKRNIRKMWGGEPPESGITYVIDNTAFTFSEKSDGQYYRLQSIVLSENFSVLILEKLTLSHNPNENQRIVAYADRRIITTDQQNYNLGFVTVNEAMRQNAKIEQYYRNQIPSPLDTIRNEYKSSRGYSLIDENYQYKRYPDSTDIIYEKLKANTPDDVIIEIALKKIIADDVRDKYFFVVIDGNGNTNRVVTISKKDFEKLRNFGMITMT